MTSDTIYEAKTEAELQAFARRFASMINPGDVVVLSGPLGAGKTAFVRAAVAALHGNETVSSPTFTIWNRYDGTPPIDHLDFYRIEDPAELFELGVEDAFEDSSSITFVEWWQHGSALVPQRRYEVEIDGSGDGPRSIAVRTQS
ncbi:MAG TPA: tRNA (adenosine(37)-N6)-threonylcarbamoyltransferase complex ATPase subunit type 1 TsaE [Candidatus Tumulicola sp.]|jgi:tRNA threonylcarbamoyladenosine biosynthesis protein TsaE